MIQWDESKVEEFFGVQALHSDDAQSYGFEVRRDGLRLLVTLFDLEGTVWASLYRDGWDAPLFTVRKGSCSHAQVAEHGRQLRCFEAGAPEFPVSRMGIAPVLTTGLRVYIEPQFQVEVIDQ